jgi:hypothetical protein
LKKEPHFFTSNWNYGFRWYEDLFADWNGQKAIGEASMTYTYPEFIDVPRRIAKHIPDTRLIYILRDPIERAYSHYLYYHHYRGNEKLSFEKALRYHPIYLGTSQYYKWIRRYLKFFEREKLMIVLFEDFIADPLKFIQRFFRFLCVDETYKPLNLQTQTNQSFKPRNESIHQLWRFFSLSPVRISIEQKIPEVWRPRLRNIIHNLLGRRDQSNVPHEIRRELQAYFDPEIIELEHFLNRDLHIWRS